MQKFFNKMIFVLTFVAFFAMGSQFVFADHDCESQGFETTLSFNESQACGAVYESCRELEDPSDVPDILNDYCNGYVSDLGLTPSNITNSKECVGLNLMGDQTGTLGPGDSEYCFAAMLCLETEIEEACYLGLGNCCAAEGGVDQCEAFSDVCGHKYQTAIEYVKDNGIVNGYEDGTYKPDQNINRAEFTKIVMLSTYDASVLVGSFCFSDVGSEWFAQYVCSAKDMGIINGYPDGTFGPANLINLAEALKIIWESSGVELEDVAGEWYQKYFDVSNQYGILDTIDQTPDHFLTRGEMAELVYQVETYE